jgi:hypothetical protein
MSKLNKYSTKLINHYQKHVATIKIDYDNHPLIKQLIEQYNTILPNPLKLVSTNKIPKLHEVNELPLVYIMWKKIQDNGLMNMFFEYVPDISDFKTFVEWYRTHQHLIDMQDVETKIASKIKDFVSICQPTGIRKKLHEELYNNSFVPLDVLHHAESVDLIYELYEADNITLHLFRIDGKESPDLNLITHIISFIWHISNKKINVDLTIFYGKQQKKICDSPILCPDNINSGSTYPGRKITLWREEEFYKVLIHELVHYVRFDFSYDSEVFKLANSILKKYISVNTHDSNNESYTEILAITLHTVMMSQLLNQSFTSLLKYEIYHSLFQMAKIISHFGGDVCDQLFKQHPEHITIKQTTNVTSYFIVKTFNLLIYVMFLNFWNKYGYYINNKTMLTYLALYEESMNALGHIKYANMVNKMIEQLKDQKKDFVHKTMRMSCLQIK